MRKAGPDSRWMIFVVMLDRNDHTNRIGENTMKSHRGNRTNAGAAACPLGACNAVDVDVSVCCCVDCDRVFDCDWACMSAAAAAAAAMATEDGGGGCCGGGDG